MYIYIYIYIYRERERERESSAELSPGSPHSIMANMLDCGLKVSKFEVLLCYYVHFWTNTLENGMNLFTPLAIG